MTDSELEIARWERFGEVDDLLQKVGTQLSEILEPIEIYRSKLFEEAMFPEGLDAYRKAHLEEEGDGWKE